MLLSTPVSPVAVSQALFGPKPGIQWDFRSQQLIPGTTFTRASSASYFDSNGVMRTSSTNVPRFDYNPSTLDARGLFIEGASTNTFTYSNSLSNVYWAKTRSSFTDNLITSLDGTVNAGKLIEDSTATNSHYIDRANVITTTSGTVYAFSVYAKAAERSKIQLRFVSSGTTWGTANEPRADYDLVANTVSSVTGASAGTCFATIESQNNGWYKCTLVATAQASAVTGGARVYLEDASGSITYTGDGVSGAYLWGAGFESIAFSSSLISTSGSSATRASDSANISDITTIGYNQSEGTFVVEFSFEGLRAAEQKIFEVAVGTDGQNRMTLDKQANGTLAWIVISGNTTQANIGLGTPSVNTAYKVAVTYKVNDFAACINGGAVQTDSVGALPVGVIDRMGIGKSGNTSTAEVLNGWIKKITYYPWRLSNAQLRELTA